MNVSTNFHGIHRVVVELLLYGPKWWTDPQTDTAVPKALEWLEINGICRTKSTFLIHLIRPLYVNQWPANQPSAPTLLTVRGLIHRPQDANSITRPWPRPERMLTNVTKMDREKMRCNNTTGRQGGVMEGKGLGGGVGVIWAQSSISPSWLAVHACQLSGWLAFIMQAISTWCGY